MVLEWTIWSTMTVPAAFADRFSIQLPADTFICTDGQVLRIPKSGGNARDRRRARRAWLRGVNR